MKEFAAYVVSQCEKKKSGTRLLVEELGELWDISQSQTYKKMKGQTVISLEEACAAARKYQFSLDAFVFGPSDTVLVRYPAIGQPPRTPHRFLGELLHTMRAILKAKPSTRIRYATNECNYCARCQTGGRVLADRGLSRLLGADWPRSLDDE